MSDGAFFKAKSSKKSNPETKTTLDAIHNQKVNTMISDKKNIAEYYDQLNRLKKKIEDSTNDTEIWRLEREQQLLEKKIKSLESDSELMDYYLRSGDILFDYYDMQDQIQKGAKNTSISKAKPGSILDILGKVSQTDFSNSLENELQTQSQIQSQSQTENQTHIEKKDTSVPIKTSPNNQKKLQRNNLLNSYLQLEEPTMAQNVTDITDDPWTTCEECGNEMIMCLNEANMTCSKCGYQEFILVDSDKPSYKDPPREVCYYAYKKINHFNEWLAQFQAKESTEIPNEIYDTILVQLKKERITNMSTLKPTKLREILRKMKCSKYYEHIPHIINRLNGQNAPFMSREDEEKLRHMFREIQPSFKKHCPKGRRNFLSYGYVLYKFCELLEMDEYLACFPLLKNRDKLYLQDKTWEKICQDQGWQYIRTT